MGSIVEVHSGDDRMMRVVTDRGFATPSIAFQGLPAPGTDIGVSGGRRLRDGSIMAGGRFGADSFKVRGKYIWAFCCLNEM